MTQVQMTGQQLNRALAELMGYYTVMVKHEVIALYRNGEKLKGWWTHTEENAWSHAPDYCTDPAASLEVQAKAIEVDNESYVNNLHEILLGSSYVQSGLIGVIEIARLL